MLFRSFRWLCVACIVFAITVACGGGGGGGNSKPFTVFVSDPEGAFPFARITCGAGGKAYGKYLANAAQFYDDAFAWDVISGGKQDWNQPPYYLSTINGTDGVQQVGNGIRSDDPFERLHGLIWSNSKNNPVEILPTGFQQVVLDSVDNNYQVGLAAPAGASFNHPFVFHGTSDTGVDLLPAGAFVRGEATSIAGNLIGGNVSTGPDNQHACIWTSHSAASFVDLHSAAYRLTQVFDVSSTQQVGQGSVEDGNFHALLWSGTAASLVDLNPSAQQGSQANAVRKGIQVGFYYDLVQQKAKACLWNGTAGSMIDLDQFITQAHLSSQALDIDDQGWIYGIMETAGGSGTTSVVWVPKK